MNRILLVDDEPNILKVLNSVLTHQKYDVTCVDSAEDALEKLAEEAFDVMITDFRLSEDGMDGLELVHEAHVRDESLTMIMITGYGTVDVAVQTMKEGAFDFITKPFKMDVLLETVRSAFRHREVRGSTLSATDEDLVLHYGTIVGESEHMHEVYRLIERVAKTDATVLVQGESGTGKELVAEAIHKCSRRVNGPYVPLNCAALSPTLLESELFGHMAGSFTGATKTRDGLFIAANRGTLLLDEIESLNMSIQSKLLRALQEKKVRRVGDNRCQDVDVRVIAASNESLEQKRDAGEFREDLFYRISVIPINLPPLRRRATDIPRLTRHFVRLQSDALGYQVVMDDDVLPALMNYSWPGNVRELQNAIACASALCRDERITMNDLPPNIRGNIGKSMASSPIVDAENGRGKSLREFLQLKEREYLEQVLERTSGNRARAAEMLGISRATLYRKLPDE